MGIKGTVRRTTDGHLIHANIDTDIIISEEPATGSTKKPEELYQVIERFAQGSPCWSHCSWAVSICISCMHANSGGSDCAIKVLVSNALCCHALGKDVLHISCGSHAPAAIQLVIVADCVLQVTCPLQICNAAQLQCMRTS